MFDEAKKRLQSLARFVGGPINVVERKEPQGPFPTYQTQYTPRLQAFPQPRQTPSPQFQRQADIAQQAYRQSAQTQQYRPPSYGTGLSGLFRRAQDIVAPDTAQDIYKRMFRPVSPFAPGAAITYQQEQKQKNLQPVDTSKIFEGARNFAVSAARDFPRAAISTAIERPGLFFFGLPGLGLEVAKKRIESQGKTIQYQPTGTAAKVLGKEPIGGFQLYGEQATGLKGKPAYVLGAGLALSNFIPGGGKAAKGLVSGIAKATEKEVIQGLAEKRGLQIADDLAKLLTKTTDEKIIQKELEAGRQAGKVISQTAPKGQEALFAEARKFTNATDFVNSKLPNTSIFDPRKAELRTLWEKANADVIAQKQATLAEQRLAREQASQNVLLRQQQVEANKNILNDLNPTGNIFTEYTPQARIKAKLGPDMTTIDKTLGGSPNDTITIYRGAPKGQKQINPGDFVTTNRELAKSYTGDGNVLELKVKKGDLLDSKSQPGLGEQTLYRPNAHKEISKPTLPVKALKEQKAVTQAVQTALPLTDDIISAISNPKTIEESTSIVKTLFPNTTPVKQTEIATSLTKAASDTEAQNIIKQAAARQQAVKTTVEQAMPAPKVTQEAALELAQEAPVKAVTAEVAQPKPQIAEVKPAESVYEIAQKTGSTPSEILYGTKTPDANQQLNYMQQYSPQRFIRENITQPIVNSLNDIFQRAQLSEYGLVRGLGRLPTGISRQIGMSPELLAASRKFLTGTPELGKITAEDIVKIGKELDKTAINRVWATLDPNLATDIGIDVNKIKLSSKEIQYKNQIENIKNSVTEGNLSRGLINQDQANSLWFKRAYSLFDFASDDNQTYKNVMKQFTNEAKLKKQFIGRKNVAQEVKEAAIQDPSYLMARKSAESHAAWGIYDYTDWLNKNGFVSDTKLPGYVALPKNKLYGESAGKFVPRNAAEEISGFQTNMAMLNSVNDLLNWYDKNPLRKGKKMLLTVLNPAVRTGNRLSNVVFAQLNGINPATFSKNLIRVQQLRKTKDPLYIEAVRQGLVGNNLMDGDFGRKIAEYTGDANQLKKALDWAKRTYAKTDDDARVAAFVSHYERGYDINKAAEMARRGFQDSKSVGYLYDTAAKLPLVGNAFVRFAGDATRIAANAFIDNPLTAISAVATVAFIGNKMSEWAGETEEDRKTREGRFGAPKIPFTDISLEFQTPIGAINVARFLPFYQLNEVGTPITRFLPFSGNPLDPKNWSDPLLGPVGQLLVDKDFRGKSIKDPENRGQFLDRLSSKEEWINRAKFFIPPNIPLGREATSLYAAKTGQPDVYGATRTFPQALGRALGVKVEKFGPKEAEQTREQQRFYEDLDKINKVAETLPKDSQEAYKRLTGYYKLREIEQKQIKTKKGEIKDIEAYKKTPVYNFAEDKYKDISKDENVYNLLLQKKKQDLERDNLPIAPEFDERLSLGFRKQLIANKSIVPGEDAEADARIRNYSEWDTYTKLRDEYKALAEKRYGKKDDFIDELVKNPDAKYPDKGKAKQAYDDAYKAYAAGKGPKPIYTDAVNRDKQIYEEAMRNWTNEARKKRKLPPISKDDWYNVSYGFQSDEEKIFNELKYGKGFGGYRYGFGGSKQEQRQYLAQLLGSAPTIAQAPEIKAVTKRPQFKVKTPGKARIRKIRLG